jgi:hypothetical protein
MQLTKIGWLGTRTSAAEAVVDLFGQVLQIPFHHRDEGFWVFQLPDGSKIEVFGPDLTTSIHDRAGAGVPRRRRRCCNRRASIGGCADRVGARVMASLPSPAQV